MNYGLRLITTFTFPWLRGDSMFLKMKELEQCEIFEMWEAHPGCVLLPIMWLG